MFTKKPLQGIAVTVVHSIQSIRALTPTLVRGITDGELGNGSNQPSCSPTPVSAPTNFAVIAAGKHYSIGVTSDGRVWAWGSNIAGELGRDDNNDSTIRNTPGVISGTVHVTAISIRYYHVLGGHQKIPAAEILAWAKGCW